MWACFRTLFSAWRSPTVFGVMVLISYILGNNLPIMAVDRGAVSFIGVVATVGGLAFGRAISDDPQTKRRTRLMMIIAGIVISVAAALAYILVGGSNMTNGWFEYVLLSVFLAIAFASFGFLAHASGLELGEPPEPVQPAT
jgi:4-hydroxybenzoate polyprenyltransferase